MLAASATVLARFTTAVVTRFQPAIAIVMAISLMPWMFAVARACQTPMAMGYVMTLTPVLDPWMLAASATVLARFTTAVATRFQQAIAIVMAISSMLWMYAVATAPSMQTKTESAILKMTA